MVILKLSEVFSEKKKDSDDGYKVHFRWDDHVHKLVVLFTQLGDYSKKPLNCIF